MSFASWARPHRSRIIMLGLLALLFWRQLDSLKVTSPTYDEYIYIARGYTYLKTGDPRLKLRHPILVDGLASLPLFLEPGIRLPLEDDGWLSGDFHTYSHAFLWEANAAKADKLVWLARLPIIWLSLLLASAVFRWSHELFGGAAALLAGLICTFDSAILAHGRLVTPDVGQTTLIFLAAWLWWRFLARPGVGRLILSGVVLGLAQAAGFPALIAYPIFPLAVLIRHIGRRGGWVRPVAIRWGYFALSALVSLVTVWAVYGFSWGRVEGPGISVPAPYHIAEFIDLLDRLRRQDLAYCCGEVYRGGRIWFFPLAVLVKTPVPTLIFLALGIGSLIRYRTRRRRTVLLWLVPLLYFGNAVRSSLNIGYRHILPSLPFAFAIAGGAATQLLRRGLLARLFLLLLGGWLVITSLSIHPYYLAYFNELSGGPAQGYRYLAVSDLDWGQDLPGLRDYVRDHKVDTLLMSWFGTTPPEHYGLHPLDLPGWPPPERPDQIAWHRDYPLPGTYAISVANLVAARLPDQDPFTAFRGSQPTARIGYSIYVYEVPTVLGGPPVDLTLSNVAYPDVPATVIRNDLRTSDVRLRWADGESGLVIAPFDATLIIDANSAARSPLIEALHKSGALTLANAWSSEDRIIELYSLGDVAGSMINSLRSTVSVGQALVPDPDAQLVAGLPLTFGDQLTLLGYRWLDETGGDPRQRLLSLWRVERSIRDPLAIFVHVLSGDGTVSAQDDRLDVVLQSCRPGDLLLQLHALPASETGEEKVSMLQLGVYRRDTLGRLHIGSLDAGSVMTDRLLLSSP